MKQMFVDATDEDIVLEVAKKDYYGVLKLPAGASDSVVRQRFKRLARRLHPDVNPSPDAAAQFRELCRAYAAEQIAKQKQDFIRLGPVDDPGARVAGRRLQCQEHIDPEVRIDGRAAPLNMQRRDKMIAWLVLIDLVA